MKKKAKQKMEQMNDLIQKKNDNINSFIQKKDFAQSILNNEIEDQNKQFTQAWGWVDCFIRDFLGYEEYKNVRVRSVVFQFLVSQSLNSLNLVEVDLSFPVFEGLTPLFNQFVQQNKGKSLTKKQKKELNEQQEQLDLDVIESIKNFFYNNQKKIMPTTLCGFPEYGGRDHGVAHYTVMILLKEGDKKKILHGNTSFSSDDRQAFGKKYVPDKWLKRRRGLIEKIQRIPDNFENVKIEIDEPPQQSPNDVYCQSWTILVAVQWIQCCAPNSRKTIKIENHTKYFELLRMWKKIFSYPLIKNLFSEFMKEKMQDKDQNYGDSKYLDMMRNGDVDSMLQLINEIEFSNFVNIPSYIIKV